MGKLKCCHQFGMKSKHEIYRLLRKWRLTRRWEDSKSKRFITTTIQEDSSTGTSTTPTMLALHHLLLATHSISHRNPTNTRPPRLYTQHAAQLSKARLPPLPQQPLISPPLFDAEIDDRLVDQVGRQGVEDEAGTLVVQSHYGPERFGEPLVVVSGGLGSFQGIVQGEKVVLNEVKEWRRRRRRRVLLGHDCCILLVVPGLLWSIFIFYFFIFSFASGNSTGRNPFDYLVVVGTCPKCDHRPEWHTFPQTLHRRRRRHRHRDHIGFHYLRTSWASLMGA